MILCPLCKRNPRWSRSADGYCRQCEQHDAHVSIDPDCPSCEEQPAGRFAVQFLAANESSPRGWLGATTVNGPLEVVANSDFRMTFPTRAAARAAADRQGWLPGRFNVVRVS